jgi:hypothetical protein
MLRTRRVSKIALVACLVCTPFLGVPVAAQTPSQTVRTDVAAPSAVTTDRSGIKTHFRLTLKQPLASLVTPAADEPDAFAQRFRGRGRGGRGDASRTAIILGSIAVVAGAAVLVYANRPDCSANHSASGCGYGTKVVGSAVLAGGGVSIVAGALTWR